MPRPYPLVAVVLVAFLMALLACAGTTPTPDPTETLDQAGIAAATAVPANTLTPEAKATPTPIAQRTPTERPTAARAATPSRPPTSEPTPNPASGGRLAPLQPLDSGAMFPELSDAELECIGDNPERQTRYVGCLEDEILARIFLAGFVPSPGPLSQETSDCVRAAFAIIDPRAVMTAGIEGDPGRAMAGSMAGLFVTMACLNDEEWETAGPQVGMGPDEREEMQCLLAALGGPGQMAVAMIAAQEGDITEMAQAGMECGLDMGPPARATARHSSTGAHGDDNSVHTSVDARDNRGNTDQDACSGHDHTGPNADEHPVNVDTNTGDHTGDHRRPRFPGTSLITTGPTGGTGLTQTGTARTPGRKC